jgi:hypothetical protein
VSRLVGSTLLVLPALAAAAALGVLPASAVQAGGYTADDTRLAIRQAAATYGVPAARLEQVLSCETRGDELDPNAVGDGGESLGVAQLNRGGLLPLFFAVGYDDPYSPYQAVSFMARAFVGEWSGRGVGSWDWTCA